MPCLVEFERALPRVCRTAWPSSCTNWYKTKQGKIVDNWSRDTPTYWWRTRQAKLAHYMVR